MSLSFLKKKKSALKKTTKQKKKNKQTERKRAGEKKDRQKSMESLIREALGERHLDSIDFEKLRQYYILTEHEPLDRPTAKALLNFLLSKTGIKDRETRRLALKAKAGKNNNNNKTRHSHSLTVYLKKFVFSHTALNVLGFFLSEDKEFQNAFEELSVTQLRKKLKLGRHIYEGPEEHRIVVVKLIYFVTTHFRKFENWRLYVKENAQQDVLSRLATIFAFDEDK